MQEKMFTSVSYDNGACKDYNGCLRCISGASGGVFMRTVLIPKHSNLDVSVEFRTSWGGMETGQLAFIALLFLSYVYCSKCCAASARV